LQRCLLKHSLRRGLLYPFNYAGESDIRIIARMRKKIKSGIQII